MHALVIPSESFICAYACLIISRNIPKKEAVVKVFCFFFFKSFVPVAAHNGVNGLDTVSSGDVKQSLLNERVFCLLCCNIVVKNQRKTSPLHAQREALHRITLKSNLSTCCLARM